MMYIARNVANTLRLIMKSKSCGNCGLIQLYDEIWGLCICDSKEAFFYGCPEKESVMKTFPDAQYDETITPVKKMIHPFMYNPKA